jgi:hypothetical protein
LERGSDIHKKIENYLSFKNVPMPEEVHPRIRPEFETLKASSPMVERELAFDKDWKQVGWFDSTAWCRIKVDVLTPPKDSRSIIIDHKTGKVKDKGEYNTQLELYGLGVFLIYPEVEIAEADLYFTDHGVIIEQEFQRAIAKDLREAWMERVQPMLNDTTYAPRPGNACRFCNFSKARGGECQY